MFLASPVLFILSAFGSAYGIIKKKFNAFPVFCLLHPLSYFLLSICTVKFVFLRFTLPMIFFLSVLAGAGMDALLKTKRKDHILTLIFACSFCLALVPIFGKYLDSRYETEKAIKRTAETKKITAIGGKYFIYMPRINKLMNDGLDITAVRSFEDSPNSDVYVVNYGYYENNEDKFKNYQILYDPGDKSPYYHKLAPNLSACRISCRSIILEKVNERSR